MSFNRRIKRQIPRPRRLIRRRSMISVDKRRKIAKKPERRSADRKSAVVNEKSSSLKMLSEW